MSNADQAWQHVLELTKKTNQVDLQALAVNVVVLTEQLARLDERLMLLEQTVQTLRGSDAG